MTGRRLLGPIALRLSAAFLVVAVAAIGVLATLTILAAKTHVTNLVAREQRADAGSAATPRKPAHSSPTHRVEQVRTDLDISVVAEAATPPVGSRLLAPRSAPVPVLMTPSTPPPPGLDSGQLATVLVATSRCRRQLAKTGTRP